MEKADQTPSKDSSSALDHLDKDVVDGVVYQRWWFGISIEELFRRMRNIPVLDDDVITWGNPRSGNHWSLDVMHMVMNQTTEYHSENFIFHLMDARVSEPDGFDNFPSPRNLITHFRPERHPRQSLEKRTKKVYLIRNPKDVAVSMYILWTRFGKEKDRFAGTWEQFFDLFVTGGITFGSWFDHVLDAEKFMADHPEVPVHIHVFEEMKLNPVETLRRLCHFMEVSDTLCEEIAKAVEFNNMKKSAKKYDEAEDFLFLGKDNPTIMRKGTIGDWKNTFTVAQNDRFEKFYREKMANSKLAPLIEKYMS